MKLYNKYILGIIFAWAWSIIGMAENYIIINQVMYDSPLNEEVNASQAGNGEFIELYNAGNEDVSLQGWRITGDGTTEIYTFPNDAGISVGGYLFLATRRGSNNTFQLSDLYTMPVHNNYTVLYQNKIMLSNKGETLTLYNAVNDTVDQMSYDGTSHLSNPDRLFATNENGTPGDSCVSLHRTYAEFDDAGKVIPGTGQWQTDRVSLGTIILPYSSFAEENQLGDESLSAGENYILTVTPLDPTFRIGNSEGQLAVNSGVRTQASIQYLDGLGRPDEVIALGVTPTEKDMVYLREYNDKQNISKQWLPITAETEGQRMAIESVRSQAQNDYSDNRPYAEIQYENSARKRPIAKVRPGNQYAGHPSNATYGLNSSDDQVRIYTVKANGALYTDGNYYDEATLYKVTVSDEDGKSVTTYTDKQDRTILEIRGNCRTYYVYDEVGRLRFVLPNLPSSKLNNGQYTLNNAYLKSTAYCYRYDNCGNMIYRRLPGSAPRYMVYDQAGQLVLLQDGIQRESDKWTMCAYDSIGRNLYTAEITLAQSHDELVSFFANQWQVEHFDINQQNVIPETGYASTVLGTNQFRLLTVNYYDTYDFLNTLASEDHDALSFKEVSGYGQAYGNATGLLTGTKVYNLSEAGYTVTAHYYDFKGRIVQSRGTRNSGGYTSTYTDYLFDGSVAKQLTIQGTDNTYTREHYRYTYDHTGRAKQVYYQLNNTAEVILSEFSYDSIGRLAQNLLHNKRDSIKYSYDMRNMLTTTNSKHFSERLFYADSLPQFAVACYNGNISASSTRSVGNPLNFVYTYNQQNRLTDAEEVAKNRTTPIEKFRYDNDGNIMLLQRYTPRNHRCIDDLNYTYSNDGHQLLSLTDFGNDANQYSTIEYHGVHAPRDTTMRYDANGNLIYDVDRGISVINYNYLNLPDTIQFINGNQIVNLYNAAGQKYKSVAYTVPATAVTPHYEIVHYTFNTDTVEFLATEYTGNIEKIYSRDDTICRIHNSIGYYTDSTYYHYIKDHLGNICAVVNSERDSLVQCTLYYPSGVPVPQSTGRDEQPYLYNGKEFVEMHGLNTYDFGFRGYYATIGRFTSIDPLAEQTPWQSPYSYAGNRFVNAIDWMGLEGLTSGYTSIYNLTCVNGQGQVVYHENSTDLGVYLVDDDWKEGDPLTNGLLVGWEIWGIHYEVGTRCDYLCLGGGSIFSGEYGTGIPRSGLTDITYKFSTPDHPKQINNDEKSTFWNGASDFLGIVLGWNANSLWWKQKNGKWGNITQLHGSGGNFKMNSYQKALRASARSISGILGTSIGLVSMGISGIDMIQNGVTGSNIINMGLGGLVVVGGVMATGFIGPPVIAITGTAIVTVVTLYGVVDILTYPIAGSSLTDVIGKKIDERWIY